MQQIGVREFYDGKCIMLTGGTGFMGKVLLEKLLRSCPGIKRIFVMCRSKRAKCPTTRLQEMAKLPLFQKLLKQNPNAFDKVVPIVGDLTKNNLGMRWESQDQVIDEVEILFNLGASLRMEANLKDHVSTNLAGTKRVLELAEKMKKLQAFIHVSTAFCQCEPKVVEEKIFPPHINPRAVIDLSEWLNEKECQREITEKLLGEHPNCYTYTKNLAEGLVAEYKDLIPISIVRPAIVIPTHHDPIPGWVDNLNGPIGILIAAGKGVLRSMMCGADNKAQMIPCDIAINAIILSAYQRAMEKSDGRYVWSVCSSPLVGLVSLVAFWISAKRDDNTNEEWYVNSGKNVKEVPVYNVSSGDEVPLTYGQIMEKGRAKMLEFPVTPGLWYPGGGITTNRLIHRLKVFFFQWIPALFIDLMLFIFGQKTFMIRVQNKIKVGCEVLEYFTMRTWNLKIDKTLALHNPLSTEEREIFFLNNIDTDIDEILKNSVLGTKQYCLKESLDSLPSARNLLKLYWAIDKLAQGFILYHLVVFVFRLYTGFADTILQVHNYPTKFVD